MTNLKAYVFNTIDGVVYIVLSNLSVANFEKKTRKPLHFLNMARTSKLRSSLRTSIRTPTKAVPTPGLSRSSLKVCFVVYLTVNLQLSS